MFELKQLPFNDPIVASVSALNPLKQDTNCCVVLLYKTIITIASFFVSQSLSAAVQINSSSCSCCMGRTVGVFALLISVSELRCFSGGDSTSLFALRCSECRRSSDNKRYEIVVVYG